MRSFSALVIPESFYAGGLWHWRSGRYSSDATRSYSVRILMGFEI